MDLRQTSPCALLIAVFALAALALAALAPAASAQSLGSGSPRTVIAYVEAGINWHFEDSRQLNDRIYINAGETPVPCSGQTMTIGGRKQACRRVYSKRRADYDLNHDGRVSASDWKADDRVRDSNHNGYIDAEDLIVAFSDGTDHDGNGFPSDISGWDVYDDQNDPATADSSYHHSVHQMVNALAHCPNCSIMPVKAGAEALDRTDDLAKAWLYAGRAGADVIASVTADLGYSSFMEDVIERLDRQGVAMTESSNDFDSLDHQGGMFHPHVVPGNGALQNESGTGFIRANTTSWGTHNMFSIADQGSTSAATSATGGILGQLMSWGRVAARRGLIDGRLSGEEAVQVLREASTPVTDTSLAWPGAPGDWSMQYGYGIPDPARAEQIIAGGEIPPVAEIESPRWYQIFDPTEVGKVTVDGRISSRRSPGFHWRLEAAPGPQPTDGEFFTIGRGSGKRSYAGRLGTLNLKRIPRSFWTKAFDFSKTQLRETNDQYTVTLKLVVTDASGRTGVDRRAIAVHHDPSLVKGFPLEIGSSGESQPAIVDLQGRGRMALVFGTADGVIKAIDARTHRELPGWPVHTDRTRLRVRERGVKAGHEPVLANVAVGDLDHNGRLSVVATSSTGKVYVFDARGRRRRGWPKTLRTGAVTPAIPRPALPFTRLPHEGAVAAPVLADLRHDGKLEIVQAGWDGRIHIWRPNGRALRGWPVRVRLPAATQPPAGYDLVNDFKLDATPAIAYLDGPRKPPSIVIRGQQTFAQGIGVKLGAFGFAFAYGLDGRPRPGWPAKMPGLAEDYGSAQEFITEGTSSPVAADVSGSGRRPDSIAVGPVLSPPYLIGPDGEIAATYGQGESAKLARAASGSPAAPRAGAAGTSKKVPVGLGGAFTTSGSFGRLGGELRFGQAETDLATLIAALDSNNSGKPVIGVVSAFPATGGSYSEGFPATSQGLDFLGSPIFADLTGTGSGTMLDGGDSSALGAYTASGGQVRGWPKFTGGWTVFSPTAGDVDGDGRIEVVTVSREGYLFAWNTRGRARDNHEWWRWQHDEHNSGNYATGSRPPGAVRGLRWRRGARSATFIAPGERWYVGRPAYYRVRSRGRHTRSVRVRARVRAGRRARVPVPRGARRITIQAVGRSGLLGTPITTRGSRARGHHHSRRHPRRAPRFTG